jgi:protein SCO1/2
MNRRPRIVLLAAATALVLAFALVVLLDLLDRPATPSIARTSTTGTGASVAENARSSSGFDGALLPGSTPRDFTLTDQRGRRISLSQYRGQVTILTFLSSTCRPTCPLIAQQIRGALDELPHPTPTLVVSADPAADTPASVRRFLGEAALSRRVEYLTGTRTELQPIWRAYDIAPAQLGDANSPHAASVLLIDRAGQKRDLFQVEQLTPEALAHDIRKLERNSAHP